MVVRKRDALTTPAQEVDAVWKRHWKLTRDPFLDGPSPYVSTPAHDEAVARLVDAMTSHQRRALLVAPGGLGKTRVLEEALSQSRAPGRRVARVVSPIDGGALFAGLAQQLGAVTPPDLSRSLAWRALCDAVRLCRWQRLHVVLTVDDCQDVMSPADHLDVERLVHVDPHPDARLTVVQIYRGAMEPLHPHGWTLAIRLEPLTRNESQMYVERKLTAAGRSEPTFTPRAIHRLHACSEGVPQGLDRLGSLALMAGALQGLEMVTPEVVDNVVSECHGAGTFV